MGSADEGLSRLEYHVLLAMVPGPLYGYALKEAVEEESEGALSPRAGTLYRVIARLIEQGAVEETEAPPDTPPHPGRARRYYALTREGRGRLTEETARLRAAAAMAEERLGAVEGG